MDVLRAEKGQQYRRQNERQGDLLTGNRGAMKSIHVETARLVEHIVKGTLTTNLTAILLFGAELFESLKSQYFHKVPGVSSASPL